MSKAIGTSETVRLVVKNWLDPNKIHLVGHSLGAHLVGKAGREFTEETKPNLFMSLFRTAKKVGRVTGETQLQTCN